MDENKGLISVIVPVFNVKEYLERCVSSILCQTYKNIEVILVDDGSTDGSGELSEEIAKRDERVKVIRKANGGVSSARNVGLEVAAGEYIGFVDGDDYIEPDMYEFLHNLIVENNADVACGGMVRDYKDGFTENNLYKNELLLLNSSDILFLFVEEKKIACGVCDKLFKKKIVKNLKFDNSIILGEDFIFAFSAFYYSNKIVVQNLCKYHYYMRDSSCIHKDFDCHMLQLIEMLDIVEQRFLLDNKIKLIIKDRRACFQLSFLKSVIMTGKCREFYRPIRKNLLREKKYILFQKNTISKRNKINIFILWLCNPLFKIIIRVKHKKLP